jgi:hypothetical protein
MRSKSIGRKQPAAHSIVATLKTEKPETTGTTNFFKRALAPLHFFSSANFDRRLDQIIQMQLQKHSCAKAPIALAPIIFLIRSRLLSMPWTGHHTPPPGAAPFGPDRTSSLISRGRLFVPNQSLQK